MDILAYVRLIVVCIRLFEENYTHTHPPDEEKYGDRKRIGWRTIWDA
jgi:hypothetical protein